MSYTEVVDTVETPDGLTFRALTIVDEDPQEPEFEGGCPIVQIDAARHYGYHVEMTGYGESSEYDDGLGQGSRRVDASDIISYFVDQLGGKREAIDAFERYLHIYHDGNLVEYGPNQGTDYTYVAYVTRTLWESWGNKGEVGKADMDEYRAWLEGDVYGVVVESKPTVEVEAEPDIRVWRGYGEIDRDGWTEMEDPVWGYYGQEYAEESAREQLAAEVKYHNEKDREVTLFQL